MILDGTYRRVGDSPGMNGSGEHGPVEHTFVFEPQGTFRELAPRRGEAVELIEEQGSWSIAESPHIGEDAIELRYARGRAVRLPLVLEDPMYDGQGPPLQIRIGAESFELARA